MKKILNLASIMLLFLLLPLVILASCQDTDSDIRESEDSTINYTANTNEMNTTDEITMVVDTTDTEAETTAAETTAPVTAEAETTATETTAPVTTEAETTATETTAPMITEAETTVAETTAPMITEAETTAAEATEEETEYFSILAPKGEVSFLTQKQAAYMADDYQNVSEYAVGTGEYSRPKPFYLEWKYLEGEGNVQTYTVTISENSDLSGGMSFETTNAYYGIYKYNLNIGTTYYWQVSAKLKNGEVYLSDIASFDVAYSVPRFLYIDTVTNSRDVGGWKTADGGKVKTGMIFRTAVLDYISSSGIEAFKRLGIKTEIELRQAGITWTESKLGPDTAFYICPINANLENVMKSNAGALGSKSICDYFALLADENSYPLVVHCYGGVDRTGYFVFLLNGLLGVESEDLYRDYLLSNFAEGSARSATVITEYLDEINKQLGDALAERFYNYLHNVHGVPTENLDSVIEIMKEK